MVESRYIANDKLAVRNVRNVRSDSRETMDETEETYPETSHHQAGSFSFRGIRIG
jgi:hypothetical protein